MGFSPLNEERSAWDWLTFFHDNCCETGYGNGCGSGILPFLSLNRHWSLIINHYVSLLLYATSYRGVSNMFVEAVSCKRRSTNATTIAHAQRIWEKRVSFLFHLPFFLSTNLRELTKLTMPSQWVVFPQVMSAQSTLNILPKTLLRLQCNVRIFTKENQAKTGVI